jgi:hypothetical protein
VKLAAQGLWSQTLSQGWVWDVAGTGRLLTGLRGLTEGGRLCEKDGTGCSDGGGCTGNIWQGYKWFIFWIPLQNRLGQILVFRLHYLGHENSALSLFVGTESDPRGHGLSYLKPGVNIGELIGCSYYDLINGPASGQI